MNQFDFSWRQRLISRVLFYMTVVAVLSAVERLVRDPVVTASEFDKKLGVAQPYFGVPFEKVAHLLKKN